MTNNEAKEALLRRTPVIFNGNEYEYMSAIIYRYDKDGNFLISAELIDKNKHSITVARIKDVTCAYDYKNQATTYLS